MNLIHGFGDSLTLLALKWESIKKKRVKFTIFAVGLVFALLIFGLANIGSYILTYTTLGTDVADANVSSYVTAFLESYQQRQLDVYVAGVLAATVLSVLITPFSGFSLGGIVPSRDLAIVKANDNYKLSDSILVQFVSSLSLLQLISLTILSSLLSIEGGTGLAVIFGWCVWIIIGFISVAFMWITEYINRKYGWKTKLFTILAIVVAIITAVVLDPYNGTNFFGVSPIFVDVAQNLYTYSFIQKLMVVGVLLAIFLLFAAIINFVGTKALSLQEPVALKTANKKRRASQKYEKITMFHLIRMLVFRYKVIWRPIMVTSLFSTIIMVVLGSSTSTGALSSIMLIIPLIVCLSFGVNMFGILGSSNIWMASISGWRNTILVKLVLVQIFIISTSYLIIIAAGLVSQRITVVEVLNALPGFIATMLVMVMLATSKSLKNPIKYTASSRGDAILPPVTLLGYMIRFMFFGGIAGGLVSASGSALITAALLATVIIICVIWFFVLMRRWMTDETYINKVIKETTGD